MPEQKTAPMPKAALRAAKQERERFAGSVLETMTSPSFASSPGDPMLEFVKGRCLIGIRASGRSVGVSLAALPVVGEMMESAALYRDFTGLVDAAGRASAGAAPLNAVSWTVATTKDGVRVSRSAPGGDQSHMEFEKTMALQLARMAKDISIMRAEFPHSLPGEPEQPLPRVCYTLAGAAYVACTVPRPHDVEIEESLKLSRLPRPSAPAID